MKLKDAVNENCKECDRHLREIKPAQYGCDQCKKRISGPNEEYRDYLSVSVYYNGNKPAKDYHLCSWDCVLKWLVANVDQIEMENAFFVKIPTLYATRGIDNCQANQMLRLFLQKIGQLPLGMGSKTQDKQEVIAEALGTNRVFPMKDPQPGSLPPKIPQVVAPGEHLQKMARMYLTCPGRDLGYNISQGVLDMAKAASSGELGDDIKRGMTIEEVCQAYPDQVAKVLHELSAKPPDSCGGAPCRGRKVENDGKAARTTRTAM